jgi:hypothetical protein
LFWWFNESAGVKILQTSRCNQTDVITLYKKVIGVKPTSLTTRLGTTFNPAYLE